MPLMVQDLANPILAMPTYPGTARSCQHHVKEVECWHTVYPPGFRPGGFGGDALGDGGRTRSVHPWVAPALAIAQTKLIVSSPESAAAFRPSKFCVKNNNSPNNVKTQKRSRTRGLVPGIIVSLHPHQDHEINQTRLWRLSSDVRRRHMLTRRVPF